MRSCILVVLGMVMALTISSSGEELGQNYFPSDGYNAYRNASSIGYSDGNRMGANQSSWVVGSALSNGLGVRDGSQYGSDNYSSGSEAGSSGIQRSAKEWYFNGTELYNSGRYEESIESFDKALRSNPGNASAWCYKGMAYYNLGRYEEAVAALGKATSLNPRMEAAWGNKGNALAALGRNYEEIAGCYDKVIELDPENALAWYNKGASLAALGRHEDALTAYDRLIEIDPLNSEAWKVKGQELGALGRYGDAESCYARATQISPLDAGAWYSRVNILVRQFLEGRLNPVSQRLKSWEV